MANVDDSTGQFHAGAGVENESGVPPSPMPLLRRKKSPAPKPTKSIKSKRSTRPVTIQERMVDLRPTLTPIQRFRTLVRKVMRLSTTSRYLSGNGPGAEPGIDVRKDSAFLNYGHINQNCLIEIADYSSVRSSYRRMTNREFISFLSDPTTSERERWVKVRWINVGGISWDVVRALALKYGAPIPRPFTGTILTIRLIDLHPLSLEELFHVPGGHRSGADYYKGHLFIRILSHTLDGDGDEAPNLSEKIVRSSSPEPFGLEDEAAAPLKYSADNASRSSGFTSKLSNKLRPSRRSGTTGPGRDDVENVDMTKAPAYTGHGSHYATYVHLLPTFLLLLVMTSFPPSLFRDKGTRLIKLSASSCKNSRRTGE